MSQLFPWGGQSIRVSALASVLPMNTQYWSPLEWIGWISLQFKGLSRVFSNNTVQKHQFFGAQPSSQFNSHAHMTTGKTIALTRRTFVGKVISLLFNILSRLLMTFLPRSKRLLISWLQSPSAVILRFIYVVSFSPHNESVVEVLSLPFYSWGKRLKKRLTTLEVIKCTWCWYMLGVWIGRTADFDDTSNTALISAQINQSSWSF